jgi:hypothetical protein
MAKGATAKIKIAEKLKTLFGADYVGESGGKHYVWENDGAEKVQIAISLTCPKTPIEFDTTIDSGGDWDFSDEPKVNNMVAVANAGPAEITEEEKQNLADLMARLGL